MANIRDYFYSLMTDKRSDPVSNFIKWQLWLFSLCYGAAVRGIRRGYEKGFFTPYKADPRVISIGNITVGGTGKTPASIAIAKLLDAGGRRASILIRGYGADEYVMLQEELKECPILVGPDRIENSKRAFYDFGVDTVILDDGFQHWKIKRDLDIVLLDATNPFGNSELLPRGILREPVEALKRADIIIVTKVDSEFEKRDEIYGALKALGKDGPVLESVYKPVDIYEITPPVREGKGLPAPRSMGLKAVDKKSVCIVSSIGNPVYFKQQLVRLGARVDMEFVFMDHYNYRKEDFYAIDKECKLLGIEFIVVTKKDAVKIKRLALSHEFSTIVLVLDIEFLITNNKKVLDERLHRLYSS